MRYIIYILLLFIISCGGSKENSTDSPSSPSTGTQTNQYSLQINNQCGRCEQVRFVWGFKTVEFGKEETGTKFLGNFDVSSSYTYIAEGINCKGSPYSIRTDNAFTLNQNTTLTITCEEGINVK